MKNLCREDRMSAERRIQTATRLQVPDRVPVSPLIYGDVPAEMLALASESEVDEYCHRLIEEVGKGGGFHPRLGLRGGP